MEIQSWKKVLENDLESISLELQENVETPCVIICNGEMGAGKTTFIRSFVKAYAAEYSTKVMSPTYSLITSYGPIVHADLYRLKSAAELEELELELYEDHTEYFFIEWGKAYTEALVKLLDIENFYELKIDVSEEAYRNFVLNKIVND